MNLFRGIQHHVLLENPIFVPVSMVFEPSFIVRRLGKLLFNQDLISSIRTDFFLLQLYRDDGRVEVLQIVLFGDVVNNHLFIPLENLPAAYAIYPVEFGRIDLIVVDLCEL